MIALSDMVRRLRPSPTVAVTGRVEALRAEGREIISLGAGEPDFDTPAHVRAAAISAIEAGYTRYTAPDGIVELKDAIREKFRRENGLEFARDEVIVCSGGKQVIFNALLATVGPGDEVIIPAPYWVSYPDIVTMTGGVPVIVPTSPESGFRMTAEALEAAITPRTKWVILNSPSNPTGAAYSPAEVCALAEVIERHPHVWVMSDEIYEHILYDDHDFLSIAAVSDALAQRTLTLNGVSKAYAMTGWRIGYGAGPAPLITALKTVQSQSTSNPCSVSQHASIAALRGPQDFLASRRDAFRERRDFVVNSLNEIPGIDCTVPEGAFYVFPGIAGLIGQRTPNGSILRTDEDFARALLEEKNVAVVFGAAFGASPFFRISYATAKETLDEAVRRISDFVVSLR